MRLGGSFGNRALLLLSPQIALGALLAVVPDAQAPTFTQITLLIHVTTAIASVIALFAMLAYHAKGRFLRPPPGERTGVRQLHLIRLGLVIGVVLAVVTGAADLWGGEGSRVGEYHAIAGLLAGLPLALHLAVDGVGRTRRLSWIYCLAAPLALPAVRAARHTTPAALPAPPAFVRHTREGALYDRAEWCGGCHVEQFREWGHSIHARSLSNPAVRTQFAREARETGPEEIDSDLDTPRQRDACVKCHAPTTFYGLNPQPVLEDRMLATQGIPCAFCHTLRGEIQAEQIYLSYPESVHRYLGQDSSIALARDIGDLLIRWRPEMHRRDYHVEFLNTSAACAGCHASTYDSWRSSTYASTIGDNKPVECQDCHMARAPRGEAVAEPGQLVPWGPLRPQRRFHGLPGGNVTAAEVFDDAESRRLERLLRPGMVTLRVADVQRSNGMVEVTVALRNAKVGHVFPTGEGGDARNISIAMELLDADRNAVAATALDPDRHRFVAQGTPGQGLRLSSVVDSGGTLAPEDRRVKPGEESSFQLVLGENVSATVVRVELKSQFDSDLGIFAEAKL